jgi:hypothetical protein
MANLDGVGQPTAKLKELISEFHSSMSFSINLVTAEIELSAVLVIDVCITPFWYRKIANTKSRARLTDHPEGFRTAIMQLGTEVQVVLVEHEGQNSDIVIIRWTLIKEACCQSDSYPSTMSVRMNSSGS